MTEHAQQIHWFSDDYIGKTVLKHFLNQYSKGRSQLKINWAQNGTKADAFIVDSNCKDLQNSKKIEVKISRFNKRSTNSTRCLQYQEWWNFNHLQRAKADSEVLILFGLKEPDTHKVDFSTPACLNFIDVFIIPTNIDLPQAIKPRVNPKRAGKWDNYRSRAKRRRFNDQEDDIPFKNIFSNISPSKNVKTLVLHKQK
jgi:hypothetical protein